MITRVQFEIILSPQSEEPKIYTYDCIDIFEAKRKAFFISCQHIHCYVIGIEYYSIGGDVYTREIFMHINKNGRIAVDSYDFPEYYAQMRFINLNDVHLYAQIITDLYNEGLIEECDNFRAMNPNLENDYQEMINDSERITHELYK